MIVASRRQCAAPEFITMAERLPARSSFHGVTAETGLDALTHAVEAFVSTEASDFSDAAAEKAIKLVKRHLLPAYQNPEDRKARQGMHNASCLAGIAFSNSGLGLNHGMAHALGARFHMAGPTASCCPM
jgi:alcohol dehydrogenase class IV